MRTTTFFMTREQIGQALEYKTPRRAIKDIHLRNKDRLDKFSKGAQIDTPSGKQETIIYNEKGIYEIIRKSGQPKADEFYDWIYDLLSKLRKDELQVIQKPQSNLEILQMTVNELTTHDKRISYLENNMRLSSAQEQTLRKRANGVVIEALNGKQSPAYKNMAFKALSAFWRDFKNHFEIPRYGDLPKKKFEEGLRFIGMWQPSTSLRIEIDSYNNQQSMEVI
jgi:prophage antirepressor-like protein